MPEQPVLFNAREAAAALGISHRTLQIWVKRDRIRPAKTVGHGYVFSAAEVARVAQEPRPKRGRPRKPRRPPQPNTLPDAS